MCVPNFSQKKKKLKQCAKNKIDLIFFSLFYIEMVDVVMTQFWLAFSSTLVSQGVTVYEPPQHDAVKSFQVSIIAVPQNNEQKNSANLYSYTQKRKKEKRIVHHLFLSFSHSCSFSLWTVRCCTNQSSTDTFPFLVLFFLW